MAPWKRRLQPSYRDRIQTHEDRAPASVSGEQKTRHRRRWGAPPPERILIGYVLSLSIMVALANAPLPANMFGDGSGDRYTVSSIQTNDLIQAITVQELLPEKPDAGGPAETVSSTSVAEADIESTSEEGDVDEAPVRQAAALRPVSVTRQSGIPSAEQTRKHLRYTTGPPSVDVAPKVRTGSMIVRYPLSALKKAIEGLVIVRFTVETSGRASAVEVLKGLDPACDAEVVEAVERARFYPGENKGQKVPAYSQMTVRFVLAESESGIAF